MFIAKCGNVSEEVAAGRWQNNSLCQTNMFPGCKMSKCTVRVSTRFKSLFFAVRTSTYVRYCIQKSNNDHAHNLLFSSLRWKVLQFLLSRINKLDCDFLHWQSFLTCLPSWETTWHLEMTGVVNKDYCGLLLIRARLPVAVRETSPHSSP